MQGGKEFMSKTLENAWKHSDYATTYNIQAN